MGTLVISAANLDTLENNMLALNSNINAVTSDIININGKMTAFNRDVNDMKNNITTLEEEIRSFMSDIRGTTIVSGAQNDILLKENELQKNYGNYDEIRRNLTGLLESININLVRKSTLATHTEKVLFSAPNYYLSYVFIAISCWFNNEKKKANSALKEALKLNAPKTSLILSFVHLKLGREQTAIKWLKKYFETQSPMKLDQAFIKVIDAFTSGKYSSEVNEMIYENIKKYANELKDNQQITERQVTRFANFFTKKKVAISESGYPFIKNYTDSYEYISNKLINAKSYYDAYYAFESIIGKSNSSNNSDVSSILTSLTNGYEESELEIRKAILKDQLIIDNNGNLKQCEDDFQNSSLNYISTCDFYTMMSNILLERKDVSKETKQLAVSFLKDYIKMGLDKALDSNADTKMTNISINEWTGTTLNGSNEVELINSLDDYVKKPYNKLLEDNTLFDIRIILSVIGAVIGLVLAIGFNYIIGIAVIIVSLIICFWVANNILKIKESILKEMEEVISKYHVVLEDILAEIVDSTFTIKRAKENYDYIINYLNKFEVENYISR